MLGQMRSSLHTKVRESALQSRKGKAPANHAEPLESNLDSDVVSPAEGQFTGEDEMEDFLEGVENEEILPANVSLENLGILEGLFDVDAVEQDRVGQLPNQANLLSNEQDVWTVDDVLREVN